jgi:LuxR family maltose regulon positive regulatory protein
VSTFFRRVLDESPVPVADALARPRLLTAVQGRWRRPVTAIVAGAGFGKTTLIAQAVRENRLARFGVDVHVRLERADASAAHLADRLLVQFGTEPPPRANVDELLECLVNVAWASAPTAICFVLDDVHEVPPRSDGVALLTGLVDRLPGNAHVLLGSRTFPEIGVARRAVQREAVVLREDDLRFTPDEVASFAAAREVTVEQLAPAEGWPALAELLARVTGVTIGEYVWEQVLGGVGRDTLERLVELAALGGADDQLATAVAGEAVSLRALLADVPLVSRTESGWWELHDVVAESILARQPSERLADIRRRGGIHAREHGDDDRAIRLLVAAGAWDAVLATLRGTLVQVGAPEDPALAELWSSLLPSSLDAEPEVLLLRTIATTVSDPEGSFELGQRTVAAFAERGDVDGEVAALARLAGIAYALADTPRIVPYIARINELAHTGHPWAVAFDAVCRGAGALLGNDWRRAEEILAPVAGMPADDATLGLATYFYARAQVASGHLREAALTIDRMPADHKARVFDGVLGVQVAVAQGLGADDSVLDGFRLVAEARLERRPLVVRQNARSRLAAGFATIDHLDAAREQLIELDLIESRVDVALDEELLARATLAVAEGREADAVELAAQVPDRGMMFPPTDALVLLYVLRPDLRPRYDALDLDGVHAQRRALARGLVAARGGDLVPLGCYEWPRAAVVRWFAPVPWLTEAAVYSSAAGGAPQLDLSRSVEHDGVAQRQVLRRLAGSPVTAVARSAAAIGASMPPAAPDPIAIRVLGPLEIDVDGVSSAAPALRRERVRSLLGLLVVRRSVRRVEAAGLLWPDLEDEPALANLRVTLTHLVKLLEPRRDRSDRPFFVHAEPDRLTLRADPALGVDAWEFEAAVAEAEELEREGAPSLALDALVRAVGYWRGELLSDLGAQEWLDFDRLRLGTVFVRSALRAGELLAAHHELAHAAAMAERAIAADRWSEAGYRLLVTVHLERGDRSAARRVLAHLDQVLDELGVEAGPETELLRNRCHAGD